MRFAMPGAEKREARLVSAARGSTTVRCGQASQSKSANTVWSVRRMGDTTTSVCGDGAVFLSSKRERERCIYIYIYIYLCSDTKVEEWLDGRISPYVRVAVGHCTNAIDVYIYV